MKTFSTRIHESSLKKTFALKSRFFTFPMWICVMVIRSSQSANACNSTTRQADIWSHFILDAIQSRGEDEGGMKPEVETVAVDAQIRLNNASLKMTIIRLATTFSPANSSSLLQTSSGRRVKSGNISKCTHITVSPWTKAVRLWLCARWGFRSRCPSPP